MAPTVKFIEHCEIGPPPASVPSKTVIPLTFFDLPWLGCPPIKRIFFYEFPHSTHQFIQQVVPNLKQSLSLTLQHFFPFSSNIVFPPKPQHPHILFSDGDSLPFSVAESTSLDLNELVTDAPRDITCLHPFVPNMPPPRGLPDGTLLMPPMAIQVTHIPNSGFAICLTFRHVVADGRAFHHFMKFWASLCKLGLASLDIPIHDRDKVRDPNGLKPVFLEALWNRPTEKVESMGSVESLGPSYRAPSDMVRRKFVLGREHVENLKKWVSNKCRSHGLGKETFNVSTFVVTCSLIWACKVKSEDTRVVNANDDEVYVFAFMADCRSISEVSIPLAYFGNCLGCGNVEVKRGKLVGGDGVFEAAVAIGSKVRYLQSEPYKGAQTLMSNFTDFVKLGRNLMIMAGSQKLDVYDTDFGWGRPKSSEVVQVETSGSISLSDCRDKESGGIEVGVALGRNQMEKFNSILDEFLAEIAGHD